MKRIQLQKKRHNKIKRRIELGVAKKGDEEKLLQLRRELKYV
jgi:hypothetical protein